MHTPSDWLLKSYKSEKSKVTRRDKINVCHRISPEQKEIGGRGGGGRLSWTYMHGLEGNKQGKYCIKKEFKSLRIGFVPQHGRFFIDLAAVVSCKNT